MYQIGFVSVLKSGEQPDLCVAGEGTLYDSQKTSFSDHEFFGARFTVLLCLDERSCDAHVVAKHLL